MNIRGFAFASSVILVNIPALADDVIRLSPTDLSVQTHKWEGKTIETYGFCFYADKNEYRCLYPGGPRIDFSDIEPEAMRKKIETNCDTVGKMTGPACKVKFQFVYESFQKQMGDDMTMRMFILPVDGKGTFLAK